MSGQGVNNSSKKNYKNQGNQVLFIGLNAKYSFVMQDGENLTKEQIEDEIQKIKNAHAEDEGTYLFT